MLEECCVSKKALPADGITFLNPIQYNYYSLPILHNNITKKNKTANDKRGFRPQ